jgi:hypothetical protein
LKKELKRIKVPQKNVGPTPGSCEREQVVCWIDSLSDYHAHESGLAEVELGPRELILYEICFEESHPKGGPID